MGGSYFRFAKGACGTAFLGAALTFASSVHAQYFALGKGSYPLEFYDIDFSDLADPAKRVSVLDHLHYIPLGTDPETYLSLGGEVRQQAWAWNNEAHGLKPPLANTYDLSRVIADAYLHLNRQFALFVQLGRFDAFGKASPLNPADASEGRLQQGFVEIKEKVDAAKVTARVGRQEITLGSGRFVWVNDSSNIRTTHDGVRVHANIENNVTVDLALTRPVTPVLDAFDDWDSHNGTFAAAYVSAIVLPTLHVDEYYYFRHAIDAQYAGMTGDEDRDTIGGRVWGAIGPFKYDSDFAYQFGTFADKNISAFGTSTRVLYSFETFAWEPGLQMQASYFSGTNNPNGGTIGTFNPPFGRPTMLNYAGLETLENLIEAYPALIINPRSDLAFRFGPEVLWRPAVNDAVYISRMTPLPQTMAAWDKASYIGTNLIATAQWRITSNTSLFAEYLHELAGPAITLAGGRGADVGVVQVDVNF